VQEWNATVTVVMLVVVQQRWSQAKDRVVSDRGLELRWMTNVGCA
jgi:hypothetical protein